VVPADLWVDPACPWTWLTARWLLDVEQVRDVRVRFHVMSLGLVLGIGPGDAGQMDGAALWGPVRISMAALLSFGHDGLRRVYPALATLIHDESAPVDREMYARALHRCGLPHSLAYAATAAWYDPEVAASHRRGMEPMGPDAGCPVLHVPGPDGAPVAFFGPVVTPAPRGDAAGRLWDSVALAAGTDGFFELKRHRTRTPDFAS
jgi:hypothetical protein